MRADAVNTPRRRRWRGWWWKLPLLFVGFSVLQVLVLRFVDPPFSAFMVARQLDALVASEDQNFANHHGFDFSAIEKAQAHNEKMIERAEKRGKPVRRLRGASTISQQTAKNLFLWQGRGPTRWLRKGLEVWYTALIEALWPKRRILEVYANIAEFGDGVYGGQAAARSFFRKDAAKLSATEAARLAAVLPSPKRYSATRPGPYVQRRTRAIERQMRAIGGPGYLRTLD